jgi:hypothetical protein
MVKAAFRLMTIGYNDGVATYAMTNLLVTIGG